MSGRKKNNFKNSIETIFDNEIRACGKKLAEFDAEATLKKSFGGSRHWVSRQSKMVESLHEYKEKLLKILSKHDAQHSGVALKDFEAATNSLNKFRRELEQIYNAKLAAASAFGNGVPFNVENFDKELAEAVFEIELQQAHFKSKNSWFKRIWSKIEDQLAGLIAGSVIGFISKDGIISIIQKLMN